jgi:restriction system protein
MPIPSYQSIMLPLLQLANDGKEHNVRESIDHIGDKFGLTEEERSRTLPSGTKTYLSDRVHWAKTYLSKAELVKPTRRAHFQITDRGREVLKDPPLKLDISYLSKFPEFREFLTPHQPVSEDTQQAGSGATGKLAVVPDAETTPDEVLRTTAKNLDKILATELLDRILASPPAFFESLIVELLLAMGYGGSREDAGKAIGKTGDGGLDGVIDQDALGLAGC